MPHHDLAAPLMDEVYGMLSRELPSPGRILLIAPDHYLRGRSAVTFRGAPWDASFGPLPEDRDGVRALERLARRQDDIFPGDHGVTEHIPRIRRAWGNVPVLPVMVRPEATDLQILAIAKALLPLLEEGAAVILSMDFSHYKPASEARREDERSTGAIRSFRFNDLNRLDIDCPRGARLFLQLMKLSGAAKSRVLATGNSDDFMASPTARTTGYVTMIF
ncbi:MAG TPA: AmmeMemoRadiSam system protein B, partial [Synergistaceae bacterium]|nr:AmmeMemoRadiSam system protein B [Synergistaceae bacterium]